MRIVRVLKIGFVVLSAFAVLGYLFLTRAFWFSDLERQARVGEDRLSKPIDISHVDRVVWEIPARNWKYNGECHVALVLDRRDDIPFDAYRKESMTLRVKVDAYAITNEPAAGGNVIHGSQQLPRLIRNWYFRTDEPLSPDARIWESSGDASIEFGLCGLHRYHFEDSYVVIEVTRPDRVLAQANPRLQIFGEHDYAVYEHLPMLRVVRDSILVLLAVCTIVLACGALKKVYRVEMQG
jgi:hypothetical protein